MSLVSTVGQLIDWPDFWALFKQYALWDLEWNNGSEWVSVKEDMTVQRSYPEPHHCKYKLIFDASQAGDYRLTFAVNRAVRRYVERVNKWQCELTYEGIMITFDWSDCKDIAGLQFSHGIKNGYFWFRIRRDGVPLGAHVEIDPATVATSPINIAVDYGYQRKGFYAAGLFWAFYANGVNAGWETSADGADWSGAFTIIGTCWYGRHFSVWFDGTYVHYVRWEHYDLFYRRGIPVNDGTINWSAAEQLVYNGSSSDSYDFPCIAVDTNGYAWIGAYNNNPAPKDVPVVLKNANLDGTWALDFVTELSAVDDEEWKVGVVPLTNGKVYVIYCRDGGAPLGQLYDGDWDAGEENDLADFSIQGGFEFSAVALGDNVHFVYNKVSPHQIRHNERVWGVGWNVADVLVQDVTIDCGPALSADPSTGDLYCFWTSTVTDHVYYKQYTGAWGGLVDWIDESTDDIEYDFLISSFYMDYGDYIGLLYVTGLEDPYNVRFAFLTMVAPPVGGDGAGAVVMGTKSLILDLLLEGVID